ncbi:MFS transporter [Demequina oxidasica]|uniref:MFS transporter n=1 Tax=Demequina oxidasica TaxID=676199 RepID=UPI000781CC73|nr:MFS transporter [Demequina oxidasica]
MVLKISFAPTTEPSRSRVKFARVGVLSLFALMGAMSATLLSRMPSMRDGLGVSSSELATLIIFGAAGALCALAVTGWSVARFGTRKVLWWSSFSFLFAIASVGIATANSLPWLFAAGYFFVSVSFAFTNVAMNAEAAEVERRMERAIMPQFHAAFSVGVALGLGVGALVSHMGVGVLWHFITAGILLTAIRLGVIPMAVLDGVAKPAEPGTSIGGPFATAKNEFKERRVVLIGFIIFAASMTEMIAAQWMALSVVDDFGRNEAIGDVIYWVFVVSMVTVRWFGAPIIGKLGRVKSLRIAAVSVVIGILLFAFAPVFWLIPISAVFWGMGAALGAPIGFSAAADEPKHAAARLAAVASFSTIAGLVVPPLVGQLAEFIPLREAMLVVIIASVTSFVLARSVRRGGSLFRSRRAMERQLGAAVVRSDEAQAGGNAAVSLEATFEDAPVAQRAATSATGRK